MNQMKTRQLNILAIQLDQSVLEFQLSKTLSGFSLVIEYCLTPEEVPSILARKNFDLILSSVAAPGWEYLTNLRKSAPVLPYLFIDSFKKDPEQLPPLESNAEIQTVIDRLLHACPGSFTSLPLMVKVELEHMGYDSYPEITMPPPPEIVSCRFASDLRAAENAALQIANAMSQMGWDLEDTTKTELLINEYCSNLIRHGLPTPEGKYLGILCAVSLKPEQAKLAFYSHTGSWNLLKALEEVDSDEVFEEQNANLCGGGRGMPIIKMCSPQIDFKQHCGVSETIFTITK